MDMDHLIGQRFSLISKSEIRYVGTLHEINPEQSTIALEDVYSHGTEGRKVDNFIPASQQKFEYIVFRGSDVKDIKIVEAETESKQPPPPNVPNDPAILNSSRPGPPQGPPRDQRDEPPFPPHGHPQHQFSGYYPPPQYGRGFLPPPPGGYGPGPGFQQYPPPPPGYFGPPGQGFPQGPNQFQAPPPPIGPPGQRHMNQQPQPPQPGQGPSPVPAPPPTSELPVDNRAGSKQPSKSSTPAPQPTTQTSAEAKAVAPPAVPSTLPSTAPTNTTALPTGPKAIPTQPKANRVTPAVPLTVNQKSFVPPTAAEVVANGTSKPAPTAVPTQAAMDEATLKAKEAVAAALAKLPQTSAPPTAVPTVASIDALSRRVSEMGPANNSAPRGRGNHRGRGAYPRSGSGNHQSRKIEIPKSDYDFESANAKFNKEDLVKEAIASGSPVADLEDGDEGDLADAEPEGLKRKDSVPLSTGKAYNKSSSFFDNISSEAKDREESQEVKQTARQNRGEEFKKNFETFGQANIDGGYRGRGRGGFRGRQYGGTYRGGYNRGSGGGGYRGRGRGDSAQTPVAQS